MKKILLLILFLFPTHVYAASGSADTYTVTMLKVELCKEVTCSSTTTVAEGSQSVNIASLSAGAEAGAFGSTSGLPIGTTFTHLRVTLDRTFTISGSVTDSNASDATCTTDGSTEANATTMHVGTKNDTSGKTATALEIVDAGSYGSGGNITIAYSSPSSAVSMNGGSPSATQMQLIYALTSSYTVGLVSPKVKVAFDVSSALGANVDAGGTCRMYPNEPTVTITISD